MEKKITLTKKELFKEFFGEPYIGFQWVRRVYRDNPTIYGEVVEITEDYVGFIETDKTIQTVEKFEADIIQFIKNHPYVAYQETEVEREPAGARNIKGYIDNYIKNIENA